MRRLVFAVAAVALACCPVAVGTPAAGAQSPTAPEVGVSLAGQPAWVAVDGDVTLRLHVDDAALVDAPGAAVAIDVHQAVGTHGAFDQTVTGASLGKSLSTRTIPIASLPRDGQGDLVVTFGLGASATAPGISVLRRPGVYPLEVGLSDTGQPTDMLVTWLVVVDPQQPIGSPLLVSWVLPLVAPPLHLPGGGLDPSVVAQLRAGGRLDRVSSVLAGAEVPLTVRAGPETLESWTALAPTDPSVATGAARARQAVARETTELLPQPYVPVSIPTLESDGLGAQVPDEYVKGSDALNAVAGVTPDPRTAFVDPADEPALARLRNMLVEHVVVRDTALVPSTERLTPASAFDLPVNDDTTRAFATSSSLERLLDGPGSPALRAQRLLAALAVVALEAPSQPRGVVLAPPGDWTPPVDAMAIVLDALRQHPLLQPATLDTLFASVPPERSHGQPVQRALAPLPPARRLLAASDYRDAARALAAYRPMVGADDPSVKAAEQALLLALTTSNSSAKARAYLQSVRSSVAAFTNAVTATAKRVTVTARHAAIPLSFQNDTKRAVRVRVHVDSAKLRFPDGNDRVLVLPPGNTTERFAVEARTSGTFPMIVTLRSADGQLQLGAPTRVTVRSAVFGGVGLALTVGAIVVLALWWGNHLRRTRRSRGATPAVA